MTHIDPGTTGAKRATWRKKNPRELLARIIDENNKASEQKWRDLFWDEVDGDRDLLLAIVQYWLDNNIRSLAAPITTGGKATRAETIKAVTNTKQKLLNRLHEEAKLMFLELIMPNGKTLKECTGQDCRQFNGWTSQLSKAVPMNKKVGEVLNENQVRKLWLASATK